MALPGTPTITSVAADDREITFGNAFLGLLRPANATQFPISGVISMNYLQGEASLQTTQPGQPQVLTPAYLGSASLRLDFNKRQFATRLNATTVQGNTYELNAQGAIHAQGLLLVDPARSNMNLAGALSNNAAEAGYLFDVNVAPNQNLVGATTLGPLIRRLPLGVVLACCSCRWRRAWPPRKLWTVLRCKSTPALPPPTASIHYLRALAANQLELARQALERVVSLQPHFAGAWPRPGHCHLPQWRRRRRRRAS